MVHLKKDNEILAMKEGGEILSKVLWEVVSKIKPGISEIELDELAEDLIKKKGAEAAFKRVEGYKHSICISVNDIVVHGIPTDNKLKEGDIVGIDCGVFYKGFNTDMAETVVVGPKNPERDKFLKVGRKALSEGIKQAMLGGRVGHISKTIQRIVEREGGYSVVRSLVGHGVGRSLHEEPEVPGFLNEPLRETPELLKNMTIAIEVIYNMGKPEVVYANEDGWTIKSKDGSLSGVFERTVAISEEGPRLLTP